MKTLLKGILGAGLLFVAYATFAQININEIDLSQLQQVPRDQLPFGGTFWIEGPNGPSAPMPCPPSNAPDAPIYALPNGQFLVDARESVYFALSTASLLTTDPA